VRSVQFTDEEQNMTSSFSLAIVLDHKMAQSLGSSATRNFVHDQPDRFEVMAVDGYDDAANDDVEALTASPFTGGTMTWCGPLSDALLLRAFEQGCGLQTAVLWDLVAAETPGSHRDGYVVLSSRQFPYG
jgi:hypothetical protein